MTSIANHTANAMKRLPQLLRRHFSSRSIIALLLASTGCSLLLEAQPRRIDPFDPNIGLYTHLGQIRISRTTDAWGIGDCNRDGLGDWVLLRELQDTTFQDFEYQFRGSELLLYKGQKDSIPYLDRAIRIGPTEINVTMRFIAVGDWNSDDNIDIAFQWHEYNDSVYGVKGVTQVEVVVLWGNKIGNYSIEDTTRLKGKGDAWVGGACSGIGQDINMDGIDDLYLSNCSDPNGGSTWSQLFGGELVPAPSTSIFLGRSREKWGQETNQWTADWEWWDSPRMTRIGPNLIDQNCDDAPDIVLYNDEPGRSGGSLSILYGRVGQLPDTNDIQIISFNDPFPPGESSQIFDITGDDVLDLVVLEDLGRSVEQKVRVYVGEPGQKIAEVYGDGTQPWAAFPTPIVLHDGWGGFRKRIYDLGDHNDDGYRDLFFSHYPFIVSYTTGWVLDSLIDGVARFDGNHFSDFVNVGDITGNGRDAIMVVHPNGLDFIEGGKHINRAGAGRRLPHVTATRRCFSSVSAPLSPDADSKLDIVPNPASSSVEIRWSVQELSGTPALEIVDLSGRVVFRTDLQQSAGFLAWDSNQVPSGTYFVRLIYGDSVHTESIIVQ